MLNCRSKRLIRHRLRLKNSICDARILLYVKTEPTGAQKWAKMHDKNAFFILFCKRDYYFFLQMKIPRANAESAHTQEIINNCRRWWSVPESIPDYFLPLSRSSTCMRSCSCSCRAITDHAMDFRLLMNA